MTDHRDGVQPIDLDFDALYIFTEALSKLLQGTHSDLLPADLDRIVKDDASSASVQQQALYRLISDFSASAEIYGSLAINAIQVHCDETGANPLYYYDKALSLLEGHAELLTQMCHAYSGEVMSKPPLSILQGIVSGISTRFEPSGIPILIPVPVSKFKYIRFTYLDIVGAIGIPLSTWVNPSSNLSILWHEVGGYAIAKARHAGELRVWVHALRSDLKGSQAREDLWAWYWGAFKRTATNRVTTKIQVNPRHCTVENSLWFRRYFKDTPLLCITGDFQPKLDQGDIPPDMHQAFLDEDLPWPENAVATIIDEGGRWRIGEGVAYIIEREANDFNIYDAEGIVENDLSWQMDWFGEFYEDLFGVQALGLQMFNILAAVLMRKYRTPDVGDHKHPPPDLRLQVMLEFLYILSDDSDVLQEISDAVQVLKASYPFFDALEAGGIHSTPLSRVAEIIARQYADIQCQERGSDWRILSDLEQKIVEAVRPALVQSASPKNILLGQQHIFDQVKQEVDEMVSELPQQDLQWLWKEVNVSPGDSIGYDDLDAICFTETDEVAPHIGTWPLK